MLKLGWQLVGGGADMAEFEDRAFLPVTGVWMCYGWKEGDAFYPGEDDYSEEDEETDDVGR